MSSGMLTLTTWSYGLAALAYVVYAINLWWLARGRSGGRASVAMLCAVALCALWSLQGWLYGMTDATGYVTIGLLIDVLRYGAWYAFILLLIHPAPGVHAAAQSPARALAPIAILLVVSGILIRGGVTIESNLAAQIRDAAWFHPLAMIVFALVLVEQLFRNVNADSLWNVKPLCVGLGAAFLFDLYMYADALMFKQLDGDAFAIRGFVHASIVPVLAVSTSRTRDWAAKIRLSQKAAFHSATLVIIGAYLLFVAGVGYYVRAFGGDWGRALQLALLFGFLLVLGVLVLSGSMRAKLRVLLGKHFFRYRYDYREEWLRFTQTLATENSPQAMGEQVIRGLADLVESPAGGLWLRDPSGEFHSHAARWNIPQVAEREVAGSALCRFIVSSGWVINLEEYRSFPRRYEELALPGWLAGVPNAWLIVPLMVGGELIGFVVLASARTSVDVNWEINDLLRTAGRQAASFLAQMQATEALLEVRKFDAFNRMSAFVVHDLKNIVTQLALMLKNAERHRANPEFQQDMLMTVAHSVERMRQLMLQLREGATPPGTPIGVDLAAILENVRSAKATEGRAVDLHIAERLYTRGHDDRIERVIGHLVQNALDATEVTSGVTSGATPGGADGAGQPVRSGRVWVKLERQVGQALIEVGDNGQGMSQEFIRERLFKPFQTTKHAGMGIGAYESSQYVHELGGKISVDSEVDVGTRITMLLPLIDLQAGSDLRQREAA